MDLTELQHILKVSPLLPATQKHIHEWLTTEHLPSFALEAIATLLKASQWDDLNDRFYKNLAFGTGGMRGRTISKVLTPAEQGTVSASGTPQHAAVGSNCLNDFNIIRATIGLFRYTKAYLQQHSLADRPHLVIAHDVRHFSRHFCHLTASTWTQLGGHASIFDGPRSTPQLSFSIRHCHAHAGVVITASHNPPHDNGYKVYFMDGGQVITPHAEGIIGQVNLVALRETLPLLKVDLEGVTTLPPSADAAYLESLNVNILNPELLKTHPPKVVFSSLHGTGQVAVVPALKNQGLSVSLVDSQMQMDPRFPTVQSPNPENAEAFTHSITHANAVQADLAIATDPDADRMGIAIRNNQGQMELLSGNTTGAMLAEYRISQSKALGLLPPNGSMQAAIIKTFVTTPLQDAIAAWHGLKCIQTLTGFKWIAGKLQQYERVLQQKSPNIEYARMTLAERRKALLKDSTFFVFGSEESYGYLGCDYVRDKDANAAVLMICELAAYLKSQNMSFEDYLNSLYLKYGYYAESLLNIYYEGAAGAQKIQTILNSYRTNPPQTIDGVTVTKVLNFERDTIHDADNEAVPHELFFYLELANGYKYAVRGSGTEPKIKFYLFAHAPVSSPTALASIQKETQAALERFKQTLKADVDKRAE